MGRGVTQAVGRGHVDALRVETHVLAAARGAAEAHAARLEGHAVVVVLHGTRRMPWAARADRNTSASRVSHHSPT